MSGTRVLGLTAVGVFLALAAPIGSAQAMSLSNPGAAATVREDAKLPTTEVRWHHGWHRHWHHGWHRWHHRRW
jgi:hypothetical protein